MCSLVTKWFSRLRTNPRSFPLFSRYMKLLSRISFVAIALVALTFSSLRNNRRSGAAARETLQHASQHATALGRAGRVSRPNGWRILIKSPRIFCTGRNPLSPQTIPERSTIMSDGNTSLPQMGFASGFDAEEWAKLGTFGEFLALGDGDVLIDEVDNQDALFPRRYGELSRADRNNRPFHSSRHDEGRQYHRRSGCF